MWQQNTNNKKEIYNDKFYQWKGDKCDYNKDITYPKDRYYR